MVYSMSRNRYCEQLVDKKHSWFFAFANAIACAFFVLSLLLNWANYYYLFLHDLFMMLVLAKCMDMTAEGHLFICVQLACGLDLLLDTLESIILAIAYSPVKEVVDFCRIGAAINDWLWDTNLSSFPYLPLPFM
ncbi:hypothetical protein SO802_031169 [Lithocarpus litseifolius]|uniref:Uncharacterized protein n=1 Tax=Lithocarpus litseifolius TaxID=425828 RepID=A0AAW2BL98_9ROSI